MCYYTIIDQLHKTIGRPNSSFKCMHIDDYIIRAGAAYIHRAVYTATSNAMKKCLTPHVFACISKLMYTYVYPYNHINMFLGCRRRRPRTWHHGCKSRGATGAI